MGRGYKKTCKKCGFSFSCYEGAGFLFPRIYKETVEKSLSGELGKDIKGFLEVHPDGAIDVETVALCCEKCGNLKSGKNLAMYLPKINNPTKRNDTQWSVAFPAPADKYVMRSDLNQYYEKFADYPHICEKCNGKMRIVKSNETLMCPKCNEPLEISEEFNWD